jgi:hypothetical protein
MTAAVSVTSGGGQLGLELLYRARADDRGGRVPAEFLERSGPVKRLAIGASEVELVVVQFQLADLVVLHSVDAGF